MSVLVNSTINPALKSRLQSLNEAFPVDDTDLCIQCESDGEIVSAAAFIQADETCYECYAFTKPEFRRQGMFSEILDTAIEYFPEDTEFLFYTNGTDPDCMAALHSLEAELIMEEHMMEIDLSNLTTPIVSSFPLTLTHSNIDGTETRHYENQYGTVNISVFSSYYYLYGFEIQEEFRGRGYGKTFLYQVLTDLAAHKPLPLRLQVSGDNLPAFSLYKKTGFQITETLFGYLY